MVDNAWFVGELPFAILHPSSFKLCLMHSQEHCFVDGLMSIMEFGSLQSTSFGELHIYSLGVDERLVVYNKENRKSGNKQKWKGDGVTLS